MIRLAPKFSRHTTFERIPFKLVRLDSGLPGLQARATLRSSQPMACGEIPNSSRRWEIRYTKPTKSRCLGVLSMSFRPPTGKTTFRKCSRKCQKAYTKNTKIPRSDFCAFCVRFFAPSFERPSSGEALACQRPYAKPSKPQGSSNSGRDWGMPPKDFNRDQLSSKMLYASPAIGSALKIWCGRFNGSYHIAVRGRPSVS